MMNHGKEDLMKERGLRCGSLISVSFQDRLPPLIDVTASCFSNNCELNGLSNKKAGIIDFINYTIYE
jgi:hypothetical protein